MMDNGRYAELSKKLHQQYRVGDWLGASATLRRMALVLHEEMKYRDELKVLVLSYYIDLSGMAAEPFACSALWKRVGQLTTMGKISPKEVENIYFDALTGRVTPLHTMMKSESYKLFRSCVEINESKILENIVNYVKTPDSVD